MLRHSRAENGPNKALPLFMCQDVLQQGESNLVSLRDKLMALSLFPPEIDPVNYLVINVHFFFNPKTKKGLLHSSMLLMTDKFTYWVQKEKEKKNKVTLLKSPELLITIGYLVSACL